MAQVRYKVDISRVLKRLAEVKKVGADGIRELTLEYAKRAASKAIRTTPPNSLKNGGNGKERWRNILRGILAGIRWKRM